MKIKGTNKMSKVKSQMSKIFLIVLCALLFAPGAFAEMDRDSTTIPELNVKSDLDSTDAFIIAQSADSANYKVLFDRIVDSVEDSVRGAIVDAWIKSGAAIALNKLASGTAAYFIVNNVSGVPTYVAMSGDATLSNAGVLTIAASAVGTSEITDGTITTDDISTTAAIPLSKLASGTAAYIVVNNAGGVPTYVAMGGDATISDGGVVTIAANAIGTSEITDGTIANADISTSAAIAYSKLNLTNSIVTGDIVNGTIGTLDIEDGSVSGTDIANESITTSDIDDGTIANADISASAAIALTKLESGAEAQIIIGGETTGVPAYKSVSGDISINYNGVVDLTDALADNFVFSGNLSFGGTIKSDIDSVGSGVSSVAVTSPIIVMYENGGGTNISSITGGAHGMEVTFIAHPSNTENIQFTAGPTINLQGIIDYTSFGAGDVIRFVNYWGVWIETYRSNN